MKIGCQVGGGGEEAGVGECEGGLGVRERRRRLRGVGCEESRSEMSSDWKGVEGYAVEGWEVKWVGGGRGVGVLGGQRKVGVGVVSGERAWGLGVRKRMGRGVSGEVEGAAGAALKRGAWRVRLVVVG